MRKLVVVATIAATGMALSAPAHAQRTWRGGATVSPGTEPFRAPSSPGGWQGRPATPPASMGGQGRSNGNQPVPPRNLPAGVETGPQNMGGGWTGGQSGGRTWSHPVRPNQPNQPGRPGGWNRPPANQSGGWTGGPGPVWHNDSGANPPGTPSNWHGKPGGNPPSGWHGNHGSGNRWGGRINGRWEGGWKAPGGWNAYRRPTRGWTLPSYWFGGFFIADYWDYGLAAPPAGYRWSRYYDDAVLIDDRGRVWDSVGGVAWDDGDYGYGADYDYVRPTVGYVDPNAGYDQGSSWGGGPPPVAYAPPAEQVQPLPCQSACPVPAGGSYSYSYTTGGGYYYGGPVTTVVTVQSAPVVTTTTTTTVTEVIAAPRVVYAAPVRTKRVYRTKLVRR